MSKKIILLFFLAITPLIILAVAQIPSIYQLYQSPLMITVRQNPIILIAASAALFILLIIFAVADHKAANPIPQTLPTTPQKQVYEPQRTISTGYNPKPSQPTIYPQVTEPIKETVTSTKDKVIETVSKPVDKLKDILSPIVED